MSARTCVECRLTFDLSKFVPRRNAQYEHLPTMAEVWRQPRCRECNKIYLRRRGLFRMRIANLARGHGAVVRARSRSAFRVIEVERCGAGRRILRKLREIVREFNNGLPDDRCDLPMHGINVVTVPVAAAQRALPAGGTASAMTIAPSRVRSTIAVRQIPVALGGAGSRDVPRNAATRELGELVALGWLVRKENDGGPTTFRDRSSGGRNDSL